MMRLKRCCLCVVAVLAFMSVPLYAQTEPDLGSWCSMQVIKSFDRAFATARLEHRSFDNISDTECCFAMLGGGYRIAPWLVADAGYEYWNIHSAGNLSTSKVITSLAAGLKRGGFSFNWREKYELAFPEGGSAYGTLRSRLRVQYSSGPVAPYLMYEYFNGFSGRGWTRSLHYAGLEYRFGGKHCLDLFYMYHLYPWAGETAACNVLGLGYVLSL